MLEVWIEFVSGNLRGDINLQDFQGVNLKGDINFQGVNLRDDIKIQGVNLKDDINFSGC